MRRRLDEEEEDARAFLGSGDELEAPSAPPVMPGGTGVESVGVSGGGRALGLAVPMGFSHGAALSVPAAASPLGPPKRDSAAQGPFHPLGSLGRAHPRGSTSSGTAALRAVVDALRQEDDVQPLVRLDTSNGDSSD